MKIIKQVGIIFAVCWISLLIEQLLPFAFPASVIGMVLLFLCLLTKVLKIEHIQEKADFLLGNMAFFFVPAGVSIMNYFEILRQSFVQLIIICMISTVITFAVTAWSVKLTICLMKNRASGHGETANNHGKTANDCGKTANNRGKTANDSGKTANDSGKTANDCGKTANNRGKTANDSGKTANDSGKTANDCGKTVNDRGKTANDHGETANDRGKTVNDRGETEKNLKTGGGRS